MKIMTTILTIYGVASVVYMCILWYGLVYEKNVSILEFLTETAIGVILLIGVFLPASFIIMCIDWNFNDVKSNQLGKSDTIKNK